MVSECNTVWLLEFTGTDDEHVVGVYSTEALADEALRKSRMPDYDLVVTEWALDKKVR